VQQGGETLWLRANGLRIKAKIYQSARRSDHPVLAVVLHGDLLEPGAPPTYHYEFARRAAGQIDNLVVAALLRPGYADDEGDRSEGRQGLRTGDNYTPEVIDAVAQIAGALRARFHPAAALLVGHSGGAAISADVLGRHPGVVDGALLVSCPCDVTAWRRRMIRSQFSRIGPFSLLFLAPVKSLSPLDLAGGVRPSARIRLVVGSRDNTAPPEFTLRYAAALQRHGVDAAVRIAPGLEHNMLLEPVVFDQLRLLIGSLSK
jgi:pimeloyl-ACP methyl ester carboxylesterase